jgi:hypothetical protein
LKTLAVLAEVGGTAFKLVAKEHGDASCVFFKGIEGFSNRFRPESGP